MQVSPSPDRFDRLVNRSDPVRRPISPRDGSGPLLESAPRRSAGDPARTETGRRRSGKSASNRSPVAGRSRPTGPTCRVRDGQPASPPSRRSGSEGTPAGPGRADHVGPGPPSCRARRRRPRPDRHQPASRWPPRGRIGQAVTGRAEPFTRRRRAEQPIRPPSPRLARRLLGGMPRTGDLAADVNRSRPVMPLAQARPLGIRFATFIPA